jgi:hypothetical protein
MEFKTDSSNMSIEIPDYGVRDLFETLLDKVVELARESEGLKIRLDIETDDPEQEAEGGGAGGGKVI